VKRKKVNILFMYISTTTPFLCTGAWTATWRRR